MRCALRAAVLAGVLVGLAAAGLGAPPWREPVAAPAAPAGPAGTVEVEVVDAQGAPVRGACVTLVRDRREPVFEFPVEGATDAGGRLTLRSVPHGRYTALLDRVAGIRPVRWRDDSSADYRERVTVSAKAARVRFALEPAGALRIDVDRGDLPATAPVRLAFWRKCGDGAFRSLPAPPEAATGDPLYPGLLPGEYRVLVRAPGRAAASFRTEVRAGETTPVAACVGRPGPCRLTLLPRDGAPAPGRYNLTGIDPATAGSSEHGILTSGPHDIAGLAPGRYVLVLWDLGLARFVDVAGEDSLVVDAPADRLGSGPCALQVNIVRRGQPVRMLFVGLLPGGAGPPSAAAWMRFAETWPCARFPALPAGEYTAVAVDGVFGADAGFGPAPRIQTLRVGASAELLTLTLD